MVDFNFLKSIGELEGVEGLVAQYKFKPYYYYVDIQPDVLTKYLLRRLQSQKERMFLAARENKILALINFGYLPWDSKIFDLKMGRVFHIILEEDIREEMLLSLLGLFNDEMKKQGYDFVDISVNTREVKLIHNLLRIGFILMGTSIINSINFTNNDRYLSKTKIVQKDIIFKEIEEVHISDLLKLAENAFIEEGGNINRFYADNRLCNEKVGKLYRKWFENCISGEQADKIFIAEHDKKAVGFIACKIQTTFLNTNKIIGSVPLNAIKKEYRKKGIYKDLLSMALKWFASNGCSNVEIKTQLTTLGAHYVWEDFGGRLVSSEYNFHKWLK